MSEAGDSQFVYLVHNVLANVSPTTHINTADDWHAALALHNDEKRCSGLPRKAAGGWRVLVLICVPVANADAINDIVLEWRNKRRQLHWRVLEGIRLAARRKLRCYVDRRAVTAKMGERALPQTIRNRLHEALQTTTDRSFAADKLDEHAAHVVVNENTPVNAEAHAREAPKKKEPTGAKPSSSGVSALGKRPAPERESKAVKQAPVDVLAMQRSARFSGWAATSDKRRDDAPVRVLRRNGDVLCSDMRAGETIAQMKAVTGHLEQRCVCGALRPGWERATLVRLGPGLPPVRTTVCQTCDRIAVAYERCTLDGRQLPQAKRCRAGDETLEESLTTSLDLCVQNLVICFNRSSKGFSGSPSRRAVRTPQRLVQKRRALGASGESELAPSEPATLRYGALTTECLHESLTKVRLSRTDSSLCTDMLAPV